eukprot:CAMPEP_0197021010 /NCGR_PEP_ID=MMETSP1384-20130603/1886_1 /TAXON_ID=29189 /ORGANISM="Ammonia sp." /LENGTH=468 /DNA_ID=CAMNT_0042448749 /DNA_START=116 /DNA_END=1522 /DNA_ORIENTATION=+
MADKDKKEPEFEEDPVLPSAEIDPAEFANKKKGDNDEDKKDEDEAEETEYKAPPRIPKEDPGDGLPTKPVDKIEFTWNKEFVQKIHCDTLHMLYLLQLALEAVRERTVERNKYFKSIGRTDRFINQLDAPQVITNFLEWHNKDKHGNLFDGQKLEKTDKLTMINEVISKIGGVKKGPATKIYTKLKKEVSINTREWFETPQKKLHLETYGWSKLYKGETVIEEASTEQLVTVLMYDSGTGLPDVAKDWTWADEKEADDEKKKAAEKKSKEDADKWMVDGITRGVMEEYYVSQVLPQKPKNKGDDPVQKKANPLIMLHCIGLSEDVLKGEPYKFSDADAKHFAALDPNGFNQQIVRKWREKEGRGEKDDVSDFWKHRVVAWIRGEESIVPDGDFKPVKCDPLTGEALMKANLNQLGKTFLEWIMPKAIVNNKGKPTQNILNGGSRSLINKLKKAYVFGILQAAQKQKQK